MRAVSHHHVLFLELFFNFELNTTNVGLGYRMSSRANANALVLALNVGAALGAGLLLSGIGLYAYRKLSNRAKKFNGQFLFSFPTKEFSMLDI